MAQPIFRSLALLASIGSIMGSLMGCLGSKEEKLPLCGTQHLQGLHRLYAEPLSQPDPYAEESATLSAEKKVGMRILLQNRSSTFCQGDTLRRIVQTDTLRWRIDGNKLIWDKESERTPSDYLVQTHTGFERICSDASAAVAHETSALTRDRSQIPAGLWRYLKHVYVSETPLPTADAEEYDTLIARRTRAFTSAEIYLSITADSAIWLARGEPADLQWAVLREFRLLPNHILVEKKDSLTLRYTHLRTGEVVFVKQPYDGDILYRSNDTSHAEFIHYRLPKACPNPQTPPWWDAFLAEG